MRLGIAFMGPFEERVRISKQFGVSGVSGGPNVPAGYADVDDMVKRLADDGLAIQQIGCFAFNPVKPAEQAIGQVRSAIDILSRAGGRPVVLFSSGGHNPKHPFVGHRDNWTDEAIERSASSIRELAREAEDRGVRLALEPHFACVASDGERTRALLDAVGSRALGVNMDIVNYCDYEAYFDTTALINETFDALDGNVFSGHLKDTLMLDELTIHMNECPAGEGALDMETYLKRLDGVLAEDDWVVVEHTPEEKLGAAISYVREKAAAAGVTLR